MTTEQSTVLEIKDVSKSYDLSRGFLLSSRRGQVRAVDSVSLNIYVHETIGLVGESGSGKTTLGRLIVRLAKPTGGDILYRGRSISELAYHESRKYARVSQMIFQDPIGSLNPRKSVGHSLRTPLRIHGAASRDEIEDRIKDILEKVGLTAEVLNLWPGQLSGGQQQRVVIARALLLEPDLIVADEPISSADVSIQAQIINLLKDLQQQYGWSMLFISHDLAMVRQIADRVAVMYLGRIVEMAGRDDLYRRPQHPYTKALLAAVPIPKPALERVRDKIILSGSPPSPVNPPRGCCFHTRCPIVKRPVCVEEEPRLSEVHSGHWVATSPRHPCWHRPLGAN